MNSIRLKLTVLVAGLLLLTVASLSVASYLFTRHTLRTHINERLTVIASDRQKLVRGYIQQQMERSSLVASRKLLRDYLSELATGQSPPEQLREDAHRSLEDARRLTPGLQAIWIADLAGRVRIATDEAHVGRDVAGTREFLAGLKAPSFFLLPEGLHQDAAILSAPALVGTNPVGVVFVLADQTPLRNLLRDHTGLGLTGEVMLGTRLGEKIDFLLSTVADVPLAQAPAMAAALNGQSGFGAMRDYRGVQVLAAYRPVGYLDWGLVTKIDEAEAYEPINVLRRLFVSIELVAFLVSSLTAYWLARRFTRPIRNLAEMAEKIANGRLEARVPVESADEIGHLSQVFNRMSAELAQSHAMLEGTVAQRTQELLSERDMMQGLLDNTPDRIYFKDRQSRFTRVNQSLLKLFRMPNPDALLGKTDFDFFSPAHAQQAFNDEQRIIQTGQPVFSLEEKETWPDGQVTWASSTKIPLREPGGQIIGTFGISRDITDRKRAEEELNRYFELSPDLLCIAGFDGHFKRVSPSWTTTLGHSAEELIARPFLELVHPDDRAGTLAEYDRVRAGARAIHFENRYRCKDGSYRWLQWNVVPIPEQQIIHGVARDVSEHKRAQDLLAQFADALNRKSLEMQEDLTLAREVHQTFICSDYPRFPAQAPAGQSTLRFAHRYLPTSTLSGDFFEIVRVANGMAGLLICDVMGHGMRAALVTSILRGLLDQYRAVAHDPGELLHQINQALLSNLKSLSSTVFATACYGVLDPATGQLRLANAGHPTPLVIRAATRKVERLMGSQAGHSPALGLMRDASYTTMTYTLDVQDRLLLFTDGIYEVEAATGQEFGLDRLLAAVRQNAELDGEQLLDGLLLAARRHSATGEFTDDVCLVSAERVS